VSRWLPEMTRSPRLVVAVDREELAWPEHGASDPPRILHRDWRADPGGAVADALGPAPRGKTGLDLIAASDLAMHWLQAPPRSLASFAELRLIAQSRCTHLYGGSAGDWWVAGDWRADISFVCAALPTSALLPLHNAFAARGVQTRWHLSWSLLGTARAGAFPSRGWSAVRSPRQVLLWHCSGGRVDALSAVRLSATESSADAVSRTLRHMRLAAPQVADLMPDSLSWLDLTAPHGAAPHGANAIRIEGICRDANAAATEAAAALTLRNLIGVATK
jgi:hypothetical protein